MQRNNFLQNSNASLYQTPQQDELENNFKVLRVLKETKKYN